MPEHWIRLRGGWEWWPAGLDDASAERRRLTLPCIWPSGIPASIRLVRSFQRPRFDPARESLSLRLDHVAGLVEARLNDRLILGPHESDESIWIPLGDDLPPRNRLTFEVETHLIPTIKTGPPPAIELWGEIALILTDRPVVDRAL
jgi:hypothetical protein